MDPIIGGALIGGGASIIGSLFGKSSSDKANKINRQIASDNVQLQREFAQNGIQWKVEDAKKAGIAPLAALGAQTSTFSPQYAGAQRGFDWSSVGQDISRAAQAGGNALARKEIQKETLKGLQLENEHQTIINDALRKNLNSKPIPSTNKMGVVGWDLPADDLYERVPLPTQDSVGSQEGIAPAGQYTANRNGTIIYYPTQALTDLVSEDIPTKFRWYRGMTAYKAAMTAGFLHQTKNWRMEKRKIENKTGKPVYWDLAEMAWRLETHRPAYQTDVTLKVYQQYKKFGMSIVNKILKFIK